jgi:hypothetical protein
MSGGGEAAKPGKPAEGAQVGPSKDDYLVLAEKIYINLAARVYGSPSAPDQKKPDPKALAAFCFKLSDAFEQASRETDREKARIEAENKAAVKLDAIDLTAVFASTAAAAGAKTAAAAAAAAAPPPPKK